MSLIIIVLIIIILIAAILIITVLIVFIKWVAVIHKYIKSSKGFRESGCVFSYLITNI